MYAKQHQLSLQFEMFRWLAVIALATILALAVASSAWGGDVSKQAQPLPLPDAVESARPMPTLFGGQADLRFTDNTQEIRKLWSALAYHHGDDPLAAREVWNQIQLPQQNETWQYVALGVTYLQEGDCDAAAVAFQVAKGLQPDNPVPSYFMGLVRLTQAQRAEHWYDTDVPRDIQFASVNDDGLNAPGVVPNSKAMYEWVAMVELTRAIEFAPHVALDQPLVASVPVGFQPLAATQGEVPPTVGELLTALGAENFVGKAHNTLGSMLVMRGALERAESHLDDAAETGLTIVHGYADLGAAYEADGEHQDAVRAYMKAVAHGDRSRETTHGVLENFGKALFDVR